MISSPIFQFLPLFLGKWWLVQNSSSKTSATASSSSNFLCPFTSLTSSGFFQPWLSQGYPFLCPFYFWYPSLPRNDSFSSNTHWGLDVDILLFLCPSCSLMWANSITFMLTAQTPQDETNCEFCRGTECAFNRITAEPSLHSPSFSWDFGSLQLFLSADNAIRLQQSIIRNLSPALPGNFCLNASCATSTLQSKEIKLMRNTIHSYDLEIIYLMFSQWPLLQPGSSIKPLPNTVPWLVSSFTLFISLSLSPWNLTDFINVGTTQAFFPHCMEKL